MALAAGQSRDRSAGRLAGLVPLVGVVLFQVTSVMTAVAVPTMLLELGLGIEWVSWIITGYLLPMATLMPAWGAAADLVGRWRIFRVGMLLIGLGSLLLASASGLPSLLAGQLLLATGAAAVHPTGTALIAEAVPPARRGQALGRLRLIYSLAGIIGAPVSGLVVQLLSWRALFVLGPLIAAGLVLLVGRLIDAQPTGGQRRPAFDAAGALVLTASLSALLIGLLLGPLLGWTAPVVLLLLLTPPLSLVLLWPIERRQAHPVVPPALVGQSLYRWLLLAAGLHALPYFGTAQLAPLLVQVGLGLSPGEAGWLLGSYPLGQALSGLIGGRLVDRLGGGAASRVGLATMLLGLVGLWLATATSQPALVAGGALLTSFGAGLVLIAMSTLALVICGPTRRASGMGLYTMVTYVGEAVGTNLFALTLSGRSGEALTAAFGVIYLVALALTALALLATSRLSRASEQPEAEPTRAV